MRKTLYFDVGTEVRLKKIKNKMKKHKVSESKIVRKALHMIPFEEMIYALNEDMKHAKFINLKNVR